MENKIRICLISDSHNQHYKLTDMPEADMIIHSGDVSMSGKRWEIQEFMDWFSELPYKHKIMIAGNHDFWFDTEHSRNRDLKEGEDPTDIIPKGITYLNDSMAEIDGLKIWGSGVTPWFHNWALNAMRGEDIKKHWDLIPNDVDIIVTHGPPAGVDYLEKCMSGDIVGCADLRRKIDETSCVLNIFGHIHEGYGTIERDGVTFVNASILNHRYEFTNKPVLIEIDKDKKITFP